MGWSLWSSPCSSAPLIVLGFGATGTFSAWTEAATGAVSSVELLLSPHKGSPTPPPTPSGSTRSRPSGGSGRSPPSPSTATPAAPPCPPAASTQGATPTRRELRASLEQVEQLWSADLGLSSAGGASYQVDAVVLDAQGQPFGTSLTGDVVVQSGALRVSPPCERAPGAVAMR